QVAADRGRVGEDPDPQHDDDARRQLRPDAELIAQVDDEGGDDDVREERHREHAVVEDAVEYGPQPAEHGVQGGHDGDRQVRLQPQRHSGLEHETGDDADY